MNSVFGAYKFKASFWQNADILQLRFSCLCLAILIYALFGSPTPDHPGVAELIIGALLLGSANVSSALIFKKDLLWKSGTRIIFMAGGICGLIGAAFFSNAETIIVRDVLAYSFLFLPLFYFDLFQNQPQRAKQFLNLVILSGLLFSVRALINMMGDPFGIIDAKGELYYLANSPAVLLAAFSCLAFPAARFLRAFDRRSFGLMLIGITASCGPILAMALTVQRASLGFLFAALGLLFVIGLARYSRRILLLIVLVLLAAVPFVPFIQETLRLIMEKTALFGLNMRAEEWMAVWATVSESWYSVLFGMGWGATFESPAVANITVSFTHSLLSSMVLKTGIFGLTLMLVYLGFLFKLWRHVLGTHFILALGLAGPVLIDVLLYASYKSLDFGLVLLLIPVFSLYGVRQSVASEPRL